MRRYTASVALSNLFEAYMHNTPYEINFPAFPPEIRALIIDQYLHREIQSGRTLGQPFHGVYFPEPCCKWTWPQELHICDHAKHNYPTLLPDLARTSNAMRGEVAIHMLRTTDRIVIKKGAAPWFARFLGTFRGARGAEAFNAIRELDFPEFQYWNVRDEVPAYIVSPDVALMLDCWNLRRIRLGFHTSRLVERLEDRVVRSARQKAAASIESRHDAYLKGGRDINFTTERSKFKYFSRHVWMNGPWYPMSLNRFLDCFDLRPMLGCRRLEEICFDAEMCSHMEVHGDDQFAVLREFATWFQETYKGIHKRDVKVSICPRGAAPLDELGLIV